MKRNDISIKENKKCIVPSSGKKRIRPRMSLAPSNEGNPPKFAFGTRIENKLPLRKSVCDMTKKGGENKDKKMERLQNHYKVTVDDLTKQRTALSKENQELHLLVEKFKTNFDEMKRKYDNLCRYVESIGVDPIAKQGFYPLTMDEIQKQNKRRKSFMDDLVQKKRLYAKMTQEISTQFQRSEIIGNATPTSSNPVVFTNPFLD